MKRNIIEIDTEKCNGCGLCVDACHEGALAMVDGKATLISDSYCDGLGHCLPQCPTDAIRIIEREADAYNEALVQEKAKQAAQPLPCGCPGSMSKAITPAAPAPATEAGSEPASQLQSWPVQIKLLPVKAPYLNGADLLIAADCTAFAHGDFHNRFMAGKITIIGCPKLDEGDYTEKLTAILRENDIRSVTVLRMEVPCCGGILHAAKNALQNCGKMIPWGYHVISTNGVVLE